MILDILVKLLEIMFFGGMIGSTIVIAISFVEDLQLLLKGGSAR